MYSHKYFLITTACVITFLVSSILAAENVKTASAVNQNLQLAQTHEQHTGHKNKSEKKTVSEHADHKKHGKQSKMQDKMPANYADRIASHAEALGLSDEQLGKIIRLHQKSSEQNHKIMHQAHKSMKALQKASSNLATDDELLRKHAKDHADAINKLAEERIGQRKAMHDILTEEQLKKLKTMKMHHGNHGDKEGEHSHHL